MVHRTVTNMEHKKQATVTRYSDPIYCQTSPQYKVIWDKMTWMHPIWFDIPVCEHKIYDSYTYCCYDLRTKLQNTTIKMTNYQHFFSHPIYYLLTVMFYL